MQKNSIPIGKLLQEKIPPAWIAKEIGKMLAPPEGYRGAKLKIILPKYSRQAAFDKLKEKYCISLRIQKLEEDGWQTEAAITKVMTETDYSRTTLFEIKNIDFEKEFFKIIGNQSESRKK